MRVLIWLRLDRLGGRYGWRAAFGKGDVRAALFEVLGTVAAKALEGAMLAVVGALALWQLNLAREIVLAAFLIAFGAMGIAFAMAVGLGSAKAIQRGLESMFREQEKE
jgi:hypothetical protein